MKRRLLTGLLVSFGVLTLSVLSIPKTLAATLTLLPNDTELEVGDTFDVSVVLDTEDADVNAIEIEIEFPADKLQVVSPNTGRSVIEIWAGQQRFNNKLGLIEMRGGIPGGLNITNGLVTTIQFRVRSSGSAAIQFTSKTAVLANDGLGTDVLIRTPGVILSANPPKPAGPIVTSPTHSEQGRWYANGDVLLEWSIDGGAEAYSYVLNQEPVFQPDSIAEGSHTDISYSNLSSGIHYFHIRALRDGQWGGSTHFQIGVDIAPPAEFEVEVIPSARTSSRQPVLKFFTTDAQSGIDHFEIKTISLTPAVEGAAPVDELFTDAQSPYVMYPLEMGSYDVVIRAYDKARNYREVTQRLTIATPILSIIEADGLRITSQFKLKWNWIWLCAFLILGFFTFANWRLHRWAKQAEAPRRKGQVPDAVRSQLDELRAYQKKYGKLAVMVLIALSFTWAGGRAHLVIAAAELTPPIITSVSNDITTANTFYVGGETVTPNTGVVVYWNNLTTGETVSASTVSNEFREWFYHHPDTLAVGNYMLWAQSQVAELTSPPSPQFTMVVRPDALRFGPARISYEFAYLLIIAVLMATLISIGLLIVHKWHIIRRKHKEFMDELRASEESIRRGFAVLRRDLEVEFAAIKSLRGSRVLTNNELVREKQIITDIEAIQDRIGKEVWELERIENEK